jgi:tyrosyl-tRNA synthetase
MGGSDQWGNMTTGTELVRRKGGAEAFALTCPLIRKADGSKFGKTEKGNVWLDAGRTSPYEFYQFWLNANDADAKDWIRIFTFLSREDISGILEQQEQNPGGRALQKTLAKEVTVFVHGEDEYRKAVATTEKLFSSQASPAESLSEEDIVSMEGVIHFDYPLDQVKQGTDLISFLAASKIFPSKGEARKMIQNGGVSINRTKVQDIAQQITAADLLHGKYILIQKGKKHYYLVKGV